MSFRLFIYYCALCGGWAAFLAWVVVHGLGWGGAASTLKPMVKAILTAGVVGMFVAGAVGLVDALLNAVGSQRAIRVLLCLGVGLVGGVVAGLIGQVLYGLSPLLILISWILVGVCVGASIGIYDWVRAINAQEDTHVQIKKVLNGIIGGFAGGVIGGLAFAGLDSLLGEKLGRSSLTIGLVLLGISIGLMIGLAQVFLKEAWIKIEAGFRAGREVMLSKELTTIGRAEACDIGLFRDNTIEKTHAHIALQNNRYVLSDQSTPAGTFLNEVKVTKPTPLKNGDLIRVGNCQLRFGERQKR